MRRAEAEKLLGGHATGTLSDAERRTLYGAALAHQDLFDTLLDEEALRELLADPTARAELLAALARPVPSKVVPFWRRPGLMGAAAGLLVAATAGLVVLRSPETAAPALSPPERQAPAAKAAAVPAAPAAPAQPPANPVRKGVGAEPEGETWPRTLPAPVPVLSAPTAERVPSARIAPEDAARLRQAEAHRAEALDHPAQKVEAEGMAGSAFQGAPAGPPFESGAAASRTAPPQAPGYPGVAPPVWTAEALPDGTTRVTVRASRKDHVILLRRGPAGVEVLAPRTAARDAGAPALWQFLVRLGPGEALDLYRMNGPVAHPADLPERGPVDGVRVRIHPAGE